MIVEWLTKSKSANQEDLEAKSLASAMIRLSEDQSICNIDFFSQMYKFM